MHMDMKKLLVFFLACFSSGIICAQISVRQAGGGVDISWNGKKRLSEGNAVLSGSGQAVISYQIKDEVALFRLVSKRWRAGSNDSAGIRFADPEGFGSGICIWRYKPWNSWSKPMRIPKLSAMPEDDVQFLYFRYADDVYAAVVPLSGNGFRATLGNYHDAWGAKSKSLAPVEADSIPSLAIAFGKDPYTLFERVYRAALQFMGRGEDARTEKRFPEIFNYLGWCTWNASDNGKHLNEDLLVRAAGSFKEKKLPIGWFLIDDGWFQQRDKRLRSYKPDSTLFPEGFAPVISRLKHQFGIRYVGIWHAFNGLWNGIDPESPLGKHFQPALFSWKEKEASDGHAGGADYYFIRPDSDSLESFYGNWYAYLKAEGFDFVKVDNQRITEQMALNNYPVFTLSDSMHRALYRSAAKYFNGTVINCMDMTADAYFNFGSSAVARGVEDYFPYEPHEGYDLQKGNAAAHVLQAVYNAIYFGQLVYPDFDLFQSHNPNGTFHAIARAINCGPIYITDNIGEQDTNVLWPLIYSDGRIIRSERPLLPTEDCLFQLQDPKVFKAFSRVGNVGLLGAWNAADADTVEGFLRPADVEGIKGSDFIVYEHFSKTYARLSRTRAMAVRLPRMGYKLYYIVPVQNDFAAFGLIAKYNAPATILKETRQGNKISIVLYEGGTFGAYSKNKPVKVWINGRETRDFHYRDQQLTVSIPLIKRPTVTISFKEE
jgi:hypothetical protein